MADTRHDHGESMAALDAYAGVEVEVRSRTVTLPALTFADGLRFMRLAERIYAAGMDADLAARRLFYEFPRAVGLSSDQLSDEDFGRVFARMFDPGQYAPAERPTDASVVAAGDAEVVAFRWEDLLADYAVHYGGPPRPDDPWPIVLALLQRMPRFESRARLRLLDSVTAAIAASFGAQREVERMRERILEVAFPNESNRERLVFHTNVFAEDA